MLMVGRSSQTSDASMQIAAPASAPPDLSDPVISARTAVAQLASLAQELCTQQQTQAVSIVAKGGDPQCIDDATRSAPGAKQAARHDSRRLEHSLLPPASIAPASVATVASATDPENARSEDTSGCASV